jgi:hypothetical protein
VISAKAKAFPAIFMFRREIFCASFFIDWKNDAFKWFAGCKKAQLKKSRLCFREKKLWMSRCLFRDRDGWQQVFITDDNRDFRNVDGKNALEHEKAGSGNPFVVDSIKSYDIHSPRGYSEIKPKFPKGDDK